MILVLTSLHVMMLHKTLASKQKINDHFNSKQKAPNLEPFVYYSFH